jgi:hypothetical protein
MMISADQFRAGPPPALSSVLYAKDYNEVKEMGGVKSTKRTPQQTDAVRFWSQANVTLSWNQAARQLSAGKRLDLADNARLFALLNMGIASAFIADWDAKFHYKFWRPVTAIRNGDQDGNDATERDAGWTPLNATPMHPEYPSAASIIAGVGAGILESAFGTAPLPFTITDWVVGERPRGMAWLASYVNAPFGDAAAPSLRYRWHRRGREFLRLRR